MNRALNRLAVLGLALGIAVAARAQTQPLLGRVVHVADGDTLTVMDAQHASYRIRLAGIDAPEKRQPWGKVASFALRARVAGKEVRVLWHKRDRYHRLVGVVLVDGMDAGLAQVAEGLAWHYAAYAREQSPEDRRRYASAQAAARAKGQGLWRDPHPIPPWEWRRSHRGH